MAQKRNYKFTNKRHSGKSVMSTVFGALSLASLGTVIYLSYQAAGEAPVNYGISGVLIFIFAIVGLVLSIMALQEKEQFLFFAKIGCLLNGLALAGISGILYAGAYL